MRKIMAVTNYGAPLEVIERPMPEPKASEVLIKTKYAGLCHSDLHQIDGDFDFGRGQKLDMKNNDKLPFALGHEIEGEVVAVGPDAIGKVQIGKTYAIFPWGGCGGCLDCRGGSQNLCENKHSRDLGNSKNLMGGYASHIIVPTHEFCFDKTGIPDGLAATYMCAGVTAFGALKKIGKPPYGAKDVLILGLGGVGMQGFAFAKAMFGDAPCAADIRQTSLDAMAKLGATIYNSGDKEAIAKVRKDSAMGTGVFAVIDFVGSEASHAFASAVVRKGGKTVVIGLLGGAMSRPLPMFPLRAFSIIGSFVGSIQETEEMLELVKSGKVAPIPITMCSIMEANTAIAQMRNGKLSGRVVFKHDWPEPRL